MKPFDRRVNRQFETDILDAIALAAENTRLFSNAEEVSVKRVARYRIKVSVKFPDKAWRRFFVILEGDE